VDVILPTSFLTDDEVIEPLTIKGTTTMIISQAIPTVDELKEVFFRNLSVVLGII
jgi:hypothetical protein